LSLRSSVAALLGGGFRIGARVEFPPAGARRSSSPGAKVEHLTEAQKRAYLIADNQLGRGDLLDRGAFRALEQVDHERLLGAGAWGGLLRRRGLGGLRLALALALGRLAFLRRRGRAVGLGGRRSSGPPEAVGRQLSGVP
jgi:hypothetical protein